MRRPFILGLLLAGNALTIAAYVIVFNGDRHLPQAGLLEWFAVLAALAALLSAAWVCILVLRLPADAAAKLWPGFVVLGFVGLVGAAGEWVLHRQYDDTFSLTRGFAQIGIPRQFPVVLPTYQADSEVALLIASLVTAAAWFTWAAIASRDAA